MNTISGVSPQTLIGLTSEQNQAHSIQTRTRNKTTIVDNQLYHEYQGDTQTSDFPGRLCKEHAKYSASDVIENTSREVSDLFDIGDGEIALALDFASIRGAVNNTEKTDITEISNAIKNFANKANRIYNQILTIKQKINNQIQPSEDAIQKIYKEIEEIIKLIPAKDSPTIKSNIYNQFSEKTFALAHYVGIETMNQIVPNMQVTRKLADDIEHHIKNTESQDKNNTNQTNNTNEEDNQEINLENKTLYGKLGGLLYLKNWIESIQKTLETNISYIKVSVNTLLAEKFINKSELDLDKSWDRLEEIGWLQLNNTNQQNLTGNIIEFVNQTNKNDLPILTNTTQKKEFVIYDATTDKIQITDANDNKIDNIILSKNNLNTSITYQDILSLVDKKITIKQALLNVIKIAQQAKKKNEENKESLNDVENKQKNLIKNLAHQERLRIQQYYKLLIHIHEIINKINNIIFKAYETS